MWGQRIQAGERNGIHRGDARTTRLTPSAVSAVPASVAAVMVVLYVLVSLALFLMMQRDLFAEMNLRQTHEEQLQYMHGNLRNALADVSLPLVLLGGVSPAVAVAAKAARARLASQAINPAIIGGRAYVGPVARIKRGY